MNKQITIPKGDSFFSKETVFYKSFFGMFILIVLQNVITYSVNIADNLMLGQYSQNALSGAAAINQIQFLVQAILAMGIGNGVVIIGSQYWGQKDTDPIQQLTGIALKIGVGAALVLTIFAIISPRSLALIFTDSGDILDQSVRYLSIIRFTYVFFVATNVLLAMLRTVQIVSIAFKLTIMTLILNVGINYCLIFGHFGCPEMGIRGAAIGTLVARIAEFIVILVYINKSKAVPFRPKLSIMFRSDQHLFQRYLKVTVPLLISQGLFAGATAMQTAIFGHMNDDAIAANAIANTMYQYCKMIPTSASATTNVLIGKAVGNKAWHKMRGYVHSLQLIYLGLGVISGCMFFAVSHALIGLYNLTPQAIIYAKQMFVVLGIIIVACSYQSPCLIGIIGGGGDSKFIMLNDIAYAGFFTIPVCLFGAFVLHLGVIPLVILMNVDQIIKCLSNGWKANSYTWIKRWTDQ